MIQLNLCQILLIFLAALLSFLFGTWIFSHLKQRKKIVLPPLYVLVVCEYCHYSYLAVTGDPISQCTQCKSYNRQRANLPYR